MKNYRIHIRNTVAAAALIAAGTPGSAADVKTTQADVTGNWDLKSFTVTTGDTVVAPLGDSPAGILTIGADGRTFVLLFDSARQPPAKAPATDEEAARLYRTMVVWTGICTTDEVPTPDGSKFVCAIDHSWNQAWAGQERSYFDKVEGDRLTITGITQPSVVDGKPSIVRSVYQRSP